MKKVLITGGTGFIGSHLTELLLGKGYAVSCLVRDPANLRWLQGLSVETTVGDCTLPETLPDAVKGASFIIHAAGLTKARRPNEYYQVNQIGTRNILDACARHSPGIGKFILISSQAAAGPSPDGKPVAVGDPPRPVSDYGWSKLLAEQEAFAYKDRFPVVVLRPSVVYGPRDRDLFELFRWAKRGMMIELAGGERFLNFCYVADLVQAAALALERETKSGSIYFVAENRPYSQAEFRRALLASGNVKARTVKIPYAAAYLIGLAAEAAGCLVSRPALMNRQKIREALQTHWTCDLAATEKDLGFKAAHPLEEGLDLTWRWYRDNRWL